MRRYVLLIIALLILTVYFQQTYLQKPYDPSITPTWTASCEKTKIKEKNEYDVIIVGSGFGGLSCGALLAKDGYKVLVVEKNLFAGGFGSGYSKEGYTFSCGAEDISGIGPFGSISYLLKELQLPQQSFFVPINRRYILDNESFEFSEQAPIESVLIQKFPLEQAAISSFFQKAKQVYFESFDAEVYNKWGIPPLVDPVRAAMPASWRQNYTKAHATALEWRGKTYQEVLDSYFTDPDIKRILCGLLGYIGAKASKNSAATVVENTFGYFFFGSYHPIGGSQRFANALASYISENNGTVLFGSSVDEITVLDNAVTGVKVGSTSFSAPVVVSNVNAKTLYLDLVDKDFLPKGFVQYIQNLPMGASIFAVHAGVHADLSQYPAIIQDRDQHIYFVIGSHNDPTVAPQNSATIAISETARFQDFANKPSFEYQHYVKNRARDLLEKAKKRLPEIQGHIVVQDSMTPITFQDLVNMPEGAIYGFDQSRVSVRPYFKSPISGLYLSNASSSGGGVEAVVINGILCKHDIEQWKK